MHHRKQRTEVLDRRTSLRWCLSNLCSCLLVFYSYFLRKYCMIYWANYTTVMHLWFPAEFSSVGHSCQQIKARKLSVHQVSVQFLKKYTNGNKGKVQEKNQLNLSENFAVFASLPNFCYYHTIFFFQMSINNYHICLRTTSFLIKIK